MSRFESWRQDEQAKVSAALGAALTVTPIDLDALIAIALDHWPCPTQDAACAVIERWVSRQVRRALTEREKARIGLEVACTWNARQSAGEAARATR